MKSMTDAERMAIEDGFPPAQARQQVSTDAKYIVKWLLGIFVLLPLVAILVLVLFR